MPREIRFSKYTNDAEIEPNLNRGIFQKVMMTLGIDNPVTINSSTDITLQI